jgi:hypothetical protein
VDEDAKLEQFLAHLLSMSADEREAVLYGRRCLRTGPVRVQEPGGRRFAGAACLVDFETAERHRGGTCVHPRSHHRRAG